MEALQFAAFTTRLGIRGAVCCVALLNRLNGDQVLVSPEDIQEWDARPGKVVLSYIKDRLGISEPKKPRYKAQWTAAAH